MTRGKARLFQLNRQTDASGVSGVGLVAEGVEFSDGLCVVRWYGTHKSTVVWDSIEDVIAIHGHGGTTTIEWKDQDA